MTKSRLKGLLEKYLSWTVLILVMVIAIAAVLLNLNILIPFLALVVAIASVILVEHHNTERAKREEKANKMKIINERLDLLYRPQAVPAKEALMTTNEGTWSGIMDRMKNALEVSHRHLALDSTLEAYNRIGEDGLAVREGERQFLKVFLKDMSRLEDEYHELIQN